ncbi:integration host factor subunit beta [Isoalcanivorax beigongshangi]|uniref:Integration host factor subunit beta n=1 Tax=Isoalcanivorax beigongshangi TaxID=3238810 RepID=A0ABV4AJX5_9GAMM
MALTKSELIIRLSLHQLQLPPKDVELAVKSILDAMADALASGERIEIRGFGSFSLHFRRPRVGRNPKTGESVELEGRYVPHFKPGKELRERVNQAKVDFPDQAAGEGALTPLSELLDAFELYRDDD